MLAVQDALPLSEQWLALLGYEWVKQAADSEVSYDLSGQLQLDRKNNDRLVLNVPNALVLGAFRALQVTGVELPLTASGVLAASAMVMSAKEVATIGPSGLVERGKQFPYSLGRFQTARLSSHPDWSQVWFIAIHSPALQALRRSYGLSSLPQEFDDLAPGFRVVVAIRRRGVLGYNSLRVAR